MPKTRAQKQEIISELADNFKRMKSAVFTSVEGYTMEDADNLRAKGRAAGVKSFVAKRTLLERSLKEAGLTIDTSALHGSILTSLSFEDEVSGAKLVASFLKERKDNPMKMVGGILEGKLMDAKSINTLAKLPGKQELLTQLVWTLNAPASGFVNVLAANIRGLVTVLNAVKEKKTA
ncbi:50S ribosomal protein L10 [bacterium]|nr:50S ribosomal protein L10 [bacterium]